MLWHRETRTSVVLLENKAMCLAPTHTRVDTNSMCLMWLREEQFFSVYGLRRPGERVQEALSQINQVGTILLMSLRCPLPFPFRLLWVLLKKKKAAQER